MSDARRNTAIALGLATGLLLAAILARAWFSGVGGNVGLAGVELCTPTCKLKSWLDLKAPTSITVLASIALVATIASVALAAHAFAMVLKRAHARILRKPLLVVASISVLASVGFIVRMLGEPFSLSYPGFLAIAGGIGVLGIVYRLKP